MSEPKREEHEPREKRWTGVIVAVVLILLLLVSCVGVPLVFFFTGA